MLQLNSLRDMERLIKNTDDSSLQLLQMRIRQQIATSRYILDAYGFVIPTVDIKNSSISEVKEHLLSEVRLIALAESLSPAFSFHTVEKDGGLILTARPWFAEDADSTDTDPLGLKGLASMKPIFGSDGEVTGYADYDGNVALNVNKDGTVSSVDDSPNKLLACMQIAIGKWGGFDIAGTDAKVHAMIEESIRSGFDSCIMSNRLENIVAETKLKQSRVDAVYEKATGALPIENGSPKTMLGDIDFTVRDKVNVLKRCIEIRRNEIKAKGYNPESDQYISHMTLCLDKLNELNMQAESNGGWMHLLSSVPPEKMSPAVFALRGENPIEQEDIRCPLEKVLDSANSLLNSAAEECSELKTFLRDARERVAAIFSQRCQEVHRLRGDAPETQTPALAQLFYALGVSKAPGDDEEKNRHILTSRVKEIRDHIRFTLDKADSVMTELSASALRHSLQVKKETVGAVLRLLQNRGGLHQVLNFDLKSHGISSLCTALAGDMRDAAALLPAGSDRIALFSKAETFLAETSRNKLDTSFEDCLANLKCVFMPVRAENLNEDYLCGRTGVKIPDARGESVETCVRKIRKNESELVFYRRHESERFPVAGLCGGVKEGEGTLLMYQNTGEAMKTMAAALKSPEMELNSVKINCPSENFIQMTASQLDAAGVSQDASAEQRRILRNTLETEAEVSARDLVARYTMAGQAAEDAVRAEQPRREAGCILVQKNAIDIASVCPDSLKRGVMTALNNTPEGQRPVEEEFLQGGLCQLLKEAEKRVLGNDGFDAEQVALRKSLTLYMDGGRKSVVQYAQEGAECSRLRKDTGIAESMAQHALEMSEEERMQQERVLRSSAEKMVARMNAEMEQKKVHYDIFTNSTDARENTGIEMRVKQGQEIQNTGNKLMDTIYHPFMDNDDREREMKEALELKKRETLLSNENNFKN